MAYVGAAERGALRLTAECELWFTQKLILQSRLEANFYGQSNPELGLRLRDEIRREIVPYLGYRLDRQV
jgi:copper resistance protein B